MFNFAWTCKIQWRDGNVIVPLEQNSPTNEIENAKRTTNGWTLQGHSLMLPQTNATKTLQPQSSHLVHQVFCRCYKFPCVLHANVPSEWAY